jgi:hypothetical protein
MDINDLTQHPPRSPRVRLGGYVHLPRLLDKCRAVLAGKNGEYNYDCPLDQRFFEFTGIAAAALKEQVAQGMNDTEILDWIRTHARYPRNASEIAAWSAYQDNLAPGDAEYREFFQECHQKLAPKRDDIVTWFDLLDLDDYVSFGGNG